MIVIKIFPFLFFPLPTLKVKSPQIDKLTYSHKTIKNSKKGQ